VTGERVLDRAGNGTERRLVEDEINSATNLPAGLHIADVAWDEFETRPIFPRQGRLDLVEIALVARRKIIESGDALAQTQQGFRQIGADKPARAGDQPGAGRAF